MKVAIIVTSLLVACAAYWPQDGFDTANSYVSSPLDNSTVSPIAALTGGVATPNLVYSEVAATESVSISSQEAVFIPVATNEDGRPTAYIFSRDLKTDTINWFENINSTGWVPNATDANTVLEIKYTALHEPSSTLFVPVHAGQNLVYFMGLNYTTGAPLWIAHWPCNIVSAPRVFTQGVIALMCDNVVHEIQIPTKLNYTHVSQNQPNVTTYALPEFATPYQIVATENETLYAIRFNGCELDFNEITIPNADLFRTVNISLPTPCVAPTSCIAAGNDVFGCGMYHIDLKTSKIVNSTIFLSAHAPDMWLGYTPIGQPAPYIVAYNEDLTIATLSIPLTELSKSNVTISSMAVTFERSTGSILVSAAADVFNMPRQLFVFVYNTTGALKFRSQSAHLNDPMWSSVAAGPLLPTGAGSMLMVSRNSTSLFEFSCCSGNGNCNVDGTCTCNTDFYANDCSLFCNNTLCGANSAGCNANGVCQCKPNYFGAFCDVYCDNTTCNGHGYCDLGDGSCICDAGFVTPIFNFSTYPVRGCFGQCSNNSCSNHGECAYANTTVLPAFNESWASVGCACHSGYYGDVCDTYCDATATCHNNGVCANATIFVNGTLVNNTNAGHCLCNPNFYNADCNTFCVANVTCNNAGTCNNDGSCACNDHSIFGFVKGDCTRSVGLSDAAFIGIIVAVSVAVLALIILIVCCCKRRDAGYTAIRNEGIRNTGN